MSDDGGMVTGPRGKPMPETPDGPLTSTFHKYDTWVVAASTHAAVEGSEVDVQVILDSYDRAVHPWMHGRRFHDLVEKVREVIGR